MTSSMAVARRPVNEAGAPTPAGAPRPLPVVLRRRLEDGWSSAVSVAGLGGPSTTVPATETDIEIAIEVADGRVTVADVAAALGAPRASTLSIDGHIVDAGVALADSGIRRGSAVSIVPTSAACALAPPVEADAVCALVWVTGPDAGALDQLAPGRHIAGAARSADVVRAGRPAARWDACLDVARDGSVTVSPLAPCGDVAVVPATGWPDVAPGDVDGVGSAGRARGYGELVVRIGDCTARVRPPLTGEVQAAGGDRRDAWTTTLHRPPRPMAAPSIEPVALPSAGAEGHRSLTGSIVTSVVSLFGGVAVAVVFHQPMLLLLGAIGAVATMITRAQSRWRGRRQDRRAAAALASDIDRFARDVGARFRDARVRLDATVDLAVALARVTAASSTLWERRRDHPDAFEAVLGRGAVLWHPPVEEPQSAHRGPAVTAILAAHRAIADAPVVVALRPGIVLGIVGPRLASRAVARSLLVQLAVAHGPADLSLAVAARGTTASHWRWTRWLPHCAAGWAAAEVDDVALDVVTSSDAGDPVPTLLVVDGAELVTSWNAPARAALAGRRGPVAGIVLVDDVSQLPSSCTHRLVLDGTSATFTDHRGGTAVELAWAGCTHERARRAAQRLARFDDPELDAAATVPSSLRLGDLVGPSAFDGAALAARWADLGADPPPRALIGASADGPVEVDLERDGPHALVAGTTGAGKSELLRTLIASLAAASRPTDLSFILVDYKGGSAFDVCAGLPHVAGVVTDLDEDQAARALRSLEAELRERERLLRHAGAPDIASYRRMSDVAPLPRLVVVIDEFATLAAELPGFLRALIGVAQRGRSLGVHLVLATQRPGTAVNDDIRANTNLRVALRVVDATESNDVVGDPVAARFGRATPGRAAVRFGSDELVVVQAARSNLARRPLGRRVRISRLEPAGGASTLPVPEAQNATDATDATDATAATDAAVATEAPTELACLVDAAIDAASRLGLPPVRRPWLDPLPARLALSSLPASAHGSVALADDPDGQRQFPLGWDRAAGHLLLIGAVGSGTTTALAALALVAAASTERDRGGEVDTYIIDFGAGELAPLAALGNVGAVVRASEAERVRRLIRHLHDEVVKRRADGPDRERRTVALLVDGLGSLRAAFDEPAGQTVLDQLDRIVADGPEVGVVMAATADRIGAVPWSLTSAVSQRWVFRLADRLDAGTLGLAASGESSIGERSPSGRALAQPSGALVQVGEPGDLLVAVRRVEAADKKRRRTRVRPAGIGTLPALVDAGALPRSRRRRDGTWSVPIGIGDRDLAVAEMIVHPGDHVLVAGPSRSGRSSALARFADAFASAVDQDGAPAAVTLVAVAGRRSPLRACAAFDEIVEDPADLPARLDRQPRATPLVVCVDDADALDDPGRVLSELAGREGVHLIVAARPDGVRAAYGHWTQIVRRSRLGLLLRPQLDLDGELLGVVLPRRASFDPVPGRGFLVVDGQYELVQVAYRSGEGEHHDSETCSTMQRPGGRRRDI